MVGTQSYLITNFFAVKILVATILFVIIVIIAL